MPRLDIRPMQPKDEHQVHGLYRLCHPMWPDRPLGWFFAHPTLVVKVGARIVGSTSFSISLPPTPAIKLWGDKVMYGHDVCVHPEQRQHGLGLALCEARMEFGARLSVTMFLGVTWAENKAMLRIFEKQGCRYHTAVPNHYPHDAPNDAGLVYIKEL